MKVFLLYKVSDIKNMELREIAVARDRFSQLLQMSEPGEWDRALEEYGVRDGELFKIGLMMFQHEDVTWRELPPNDLNMIGNCVDMDKLLPEQIDRSIMWTASPKDEVISIHLEATVGTIKYINVDSPQGCLCGKEMNLIMQDKNYRLWACPPLGCGRLLLEDNKEHLGSTWYEAIQNVRPGQRG